MVVQLLDAASAAVQSIAGESDDVEWVHHRDRVRQFLDGGVLEFSEPVHRHDFDLLRQVGILSPTGGGETAG